MHKGLCVYPGSFDPVTLGHVDLIERASVLFPEAVVAVLNNPDKRGKFPVEQRMDMLRRACAHLTNVRIDSFGGLLVDYMRKQGAGIVLRGLRAVTDFEKRVPNGAGESANRAGNRNPVFDDLAPLRLHQFQRGQADRVLRRGFFLAGARGDHQRYPECAYR